MGNVNKAFFGCVSQQVGWWKKSSLPNECVVGLKSFYQKEFFFLSLMNTLLRNHALMKKLSNQKNTDFFYRCKKIPANMCPILWIEQCWHRSVRRIYLLLFCSFFHCNFTNCIFKMKMSLMDRYDGSIWAFCGER